MTELDPDLLDAAFDNLPDAGAIIDAEGRILRVNGQWRDFAAANEGEPEGGYVGWNYLDVCRCSQDEDAHVATRLLERVLAGDQDSMSLEYPCHSPEAHRWFLMRASRMMVGQRTYAIVSHVDITKRRLAEMAAIRRAESDELTGLLTRGSFVQRLEQALRRAGRSGSHVAVLFLDLDGFKDINDGLGHAVGDELLRGVAERLAHGLREADGIARFGGDEFVVFAECDAESGAPARVAERLHALLEAPLEKGGRALRVTGSVGVSLYPEDGAEVETLLRLADHAMYRAKDGEESRTCHAAEIRDTPATDPPST